MASTTILIEFMTATFPIFHTFIQNRDHIINARAFDNH